MFKKISALVSKEDLWNRVMEDLKDKIQKKSYKTWFLPLEGFWEEDKLVLVTPNEFSKEWLKNRYLKIINATVYELTGESIPLSIRSESQKNNLYSSSTN